jgi:hypothetical protein
MPTGKHELVHAGVHVPGRPALPDPAEPVEPAAPPSPLALAAPLVPPEPLRPPTPPLPAGPASVVMSPGSGPVVGGAQRVHSAAKYPPLLERMSDLHWCTPMVPVDAQVHGSVWPGGAHSAPVGGGGMVIPVEPALLGPASTFAPLPAEPLGMSWF